MAARPVISDVLLENRVLLTKELDCTELVGWLYSRKRISEAEKEDVEAVTAKQRKTGRLLDILGTK